MILKTEQDLINEINLLNKLIGDIWIISNSFDARQKINNPETILELINKLDEISVLIADTPSQTLALPTLSDITE